MRRSAFILPRFPKAALVIAFAGAFSVVSTGFGPAANAREPKLVEGKTTLYQKVLTRPGAKLAQGVGAPGEQEVDPFTVYYVYERMPVDGGGPTYLEVGNDTKGNVVGFMTEAETIPWRHSMILSFAERVNRDRVVFLKDEASLDAWIKDSQAAKKAAAARQEIDKKQSVPENSPVISIEPKALVDFKTNFYMLPVLSAQRVTLPSGFPARKVHLASVTRSDPAVQQAKPRRRLNLEDLNKYRAGVVFVIDASSSMQPYIDRTRAIMGQVLDQVAEVGLSDRVRFGLVAYRDDPEKVKDIEFLTKTFANPNDTASKEAFVSAIEPLKASRVSTRAFSEDGFAAIDHALKQIDWEAFDGRYLVMITDASSREGKTAYASTNLNSGDVANLIRSKNAALYVFHQKSPVGVDDHAKGEAQYKVISAFPGIAPLYYPVEAGDPEAFSETMGKLATSLIEQVKGGKEAVKAQLLQEARQAEATAKPAQSGPVDVEKSAALVGQAMAMRYLGKVQGSEAPPMFESWTLDRDLEKPSIASLEVRVLVTKNQMSDLQRTLQSTVEALETGQIEPDELFNRLRSAAVAMGRDPSTVGQGDVKNMADTGLMGEYLEGLPYQSKIMRLDEDEWVDKSIEEQEEIINDIYSKIDLYQRLHDDDKLWIALHDGDDPGDFVYPLLIDSLP